MTKINKKINLIFSRIDKAHLEWLCLFAIVLILFPVVKLGKGAIFPILDQLDETILNYVFPARYPGADVYEQMMCGVPSTALKPFAPGFVLFYRLFSPFVAFVLQYAVVIATAGLGTYACVKRLTDSSIVSLLAGAVFAVLPFRSIYGISLAATPFLIACVIKLREGLKKQERKVFSDICIPIAGLIYYALFSSLVLVGYAAIVMLGLFFIGELIITRKCDKAVIIAAAVLVTVYALTNLDLISQLLFGGQFESHREEYVISGFNFWGTFKGIMMNGMQHYESFQKYIFIPIIVAVPFAVYDLVKNGNLWKVYVVTAILMVVTGLLYAFFASDFVADYRNNMTGMLKTFQAQRFYWLLVGGWYVSLGVSLALIWRPLREKSAVIGVAAVIFLYTPTLLYVAKNPDGIFYQNINQINNGSDITGYISWEAFYGEDLMQEIETAIGRNMSDYRVAHIAMSPAPSLMHGFYTVDGYSNDYPLEYKHEFAKVIARELDKNEINHDYYYNWGNRCYLFYSDFGGAYMLGKNFDGKISGMEFDLDALRDMGCEYIFSGAEISDAKAQGIELLNVFSDDVSYWKIWVYRL